MHANFNEFFFFFFFEIIVFLISSFKVVHVLKVDKMFLAPKKNHIKWEIKILGVHRAFGLMI